MQRLIIYLERLLSRHECVVVPSFGAFIKEALAPSYVPGERMVYPGRERVFFSADLRDRDNLLDTEYAHNYGISLRRARMMVDEDVKKIESSLYTCGEVKFGTIGTLTLQKEGGLLFTPNHDIPFLGTGDFYGYAPYPMPPSLETQGFYEAQPVRAMYRKSGEEAEISGNSKGKYLYFRVHKGVASVAAACIIAGAVALSLPDRDNHTSPPERYMAGFTISDRSEPLFPNQSEDFTQSSPLQPGTVDSKGAENPESNTKKSSSASQTASHYVIVASFETEERAGSYAQELGQHDENHVFGCLRSGRFHLVYMYASNSSSEAMEFAQNIRNANKAYRDAWVYHRKS